MPLFAVLASRYRYNFFEEEKVSQAHKGSNTLLSLLIIIRVCRIKIWIVRKSMCWAICRLVHDIDNFEEEKVSHKGTNNYYYCYYLLLLLRRRRLLLLRTTTVFKPTRLDFARILVFYVFPKYSLKGTARKYGKRTDCDVVKRIGIVVLKKIRTIYIETQKTSTSYETPGIVGS